MSCIIHHVITTACFYPLSLLYLMRIIYANNIRHFSQHMQTVTSHFLSESIKALVSFRVDFVYSKKSF